MKERNLYGRPITEAPTSLLKSLLLAYEMYGPAADAEVIRAEIRRRQTGLVDQLPRIPVEGPIYKTVWK